MEHIGRQARDLLEVVLADTPIAVIQGARQVGKTTLARGLDDRPTRYVTLDDESTRTAAHADPAAFVDQLREGCLVIDEIQRAPGLVLALKASVDRDRRPGRFVVTGSANLLRLPAMSDRPRGQGSAPASVES